MSCVGKKDKQFGAKTYESEA